MQAARLLGNTWQNEVLTSGSRGSRELWRQWEQSPGSGREQVPRTLEAGGTGPSSGLRWYQPERVLEDPVSASVP